MLAIDEDDEFLMKTEDVRPAYVEMQRTIKSALHVFK